MFTKHLPKQYTPIILVALALLTLLTVALVADLDSRVDFLWGDKTNVATSTDGTTAETVNTSNWKTYRNEEYGFEFKYPDSWVLEQNFPYSISISKSGASYGHIATTERNLDELSINEWFKRQNLPMPDYKYTFNGIDILSHSKLEKGHHEEDFVLANFTKGKNIYELEWAVDPRGAFEYLNSSDNVGQKYKISYDEFIGIISTFKFFK